MVFLKLVLVSFDIKVTNLVEIFHLFIYILNNRLMIWSSGFFCFSCSIMLSTNIALRDFILSISLLLYETSTLLQSFQIFCLKSKKLSWITDSFCLKWIIFSTYSFCIYLIFVAESDFEIFWNIFLCFPEMILVIFYYHNSILCLIK